VLRPGTASEDIEKNEAGPNDGHKRNQPLTRKLGPQKTQTKARQADIQWVSNGKQHKGVSVPDRRTLHIHPQTQ